MTIYLIAFYATQHIEHGPVTTKHTTHSLYPDSSTPSLYNPTHYAQQPFLLGTTKTTTHNNPFHHAQPKLPHTALLSLVNLQPVQPNSPRTTTLSTRHNQNYLAQQPIPPRTAQATTHCLAQSRQPPTCTTQLTTHKNPLRYVQPNPPRTTTSLAESRQPPAQTPSIGLRHPSFGGRCRKAMLGVCLQPAQPKLTHTTHYTTHNPTHHA